MACFEFKYSNQQNDLQGENPPKSNPPTEYTKTNRICHKGSAGLNKSYRICSNRPTLYGKTYRIAQSSRPNATKPVFRNKKKDYKGKHSYIYAYIFSLALARVIPFFIILLNNNLKGEDMKRKNLVIVVIVFGLMGLSAMGQNLVPNGSFEIYDTCPSGNGQINY